MRGVPFEIARVQSTAAAGHDEGPGGARGVGALAGMDACLRAYVALQQLVLCPAFADPVGRHTGRASLSSSMAPARKKGAASASGASRGRGGAGASTQAAGGLEVSVAFEHVSGVPLDRLLKHCGPLSVDRWQCRRVVRDITEAVLAMHTQSTYRLDAAPKPGSSRTGDAFVASEQDVLVCDRGLRCVLDGLRWGQPIRQGDPGWARAVEDRERQLREALGRMLTVLTGGDSAYA